jgi:hypothetical protein
MWSIYFYWGFGLGFEAYEDDLLLDDGTEIVASYFLINIGPVRIQHGEYFEE